MVDATYVDIARAIRPGTRENELVAIANDRLFRMGSERVECVNSVSGPRGRPHSKRKACGPGEGRTRGAPPASGGGSA